ncbi:MULTISPECIES: hypothetical protein [unclassified Enterococcus]|uniref:hypothetical protein n=1 Tax=unclassified Enterococcus TaxID=2608891 RepID=UPI001551820A|nr:MULTISPECIES: hypothetical protein [unclassified Enterococcus]MBS7576281.1 hypothetical protein [Enterococcus sp. MMGLQ5-2]MBS7583514.1 hypothetical protein [Enterococcus sp. MMGLQ5-1]NPD11376.1 hypothetical protein [Enterococcus sp. MMGLQ5-1]NPD36119.1 hypothetical protein [Enterococcus sp. MMGLQ5-2]
MFLEATKGSFKNLVQRLKEHLLSENCLQFEAVSDKGMHLNLFLEATKGSFKNLVQRLKEHLLSENCLQFEAVI